MTKNPSASARPSLTAFVARSSPPPACTREHADEWAKMLVWANLRGTDSHGIIRIPRYIDLVNAKSINAAPNIRVDAQARRGRDGAGGRPRAVGGGADPRHDRGDRGRARGRRRLVRGAPTHPHRRHRLFRLAGRGGGLCRHRHERVRADDGLSGHAGARRCRPIRSRSPCRAGTAGRICSTSPPASSPTARSWARPTAARKSRSAGASTRTATTPPIRRRSRTCCRWPASRAPACRS